jgi:hypothetical protein
MRLGEKGRDPEGDPGGDTIRMSTVASGAASGVGRPDQDCVRVSD